MNAASHEVCMLVGDVSGGSRLHEKLGDTEALHAVERCLNRMQRAAGAHNAHHVRIRGNELTAVFDDPAAAMRAAIEMQRRIEDLPPASGVKLAIRVVVHCGRVLMEHDEVAGEAVDTAARLAALARAGQIVASVETVLRLPAELQAATRDMDTTETQRTGAQPRIREVIWWENVEPATLAATLAPVAPVTARLKLRHGDAEFILGPARRAVTLGRDRTCDVVIADSRASRAHGRVELRHGRFVLVDQSTNGTYVTFQGESEQRIKHAEITLRGRGRMVFGRAYSAEVSDIVEFALED